MHYVVPDWETGLKSGIFVVNRLRKWGCFDIVLDPQNTGVEVDASGWLGKWKGKVFCCQTRRFDGRHCEQVVRGRFFKN